MRVCIARSKVAQLLDANKQPEPRAPGSGGPSEREKKVRASSRSWVGGVCRNGTPQSEDRLGDCRGWKVAQVNAHTCAVALLCPRARLARSHVYTLQKRPDRCMHTYPCASGDGWPYPPARCASVPVPCVAPPPKCRRIYTSLHAGGGEANTCGRCRACIYM